MFNSMQPSRPKLPHHHPLPPTNQQQTRSTSSSLSQQPQLPSRAVQHPPAVPPPFFPRNQIEAMPPTPLPLPLTIPPFHSRNPILAPQHLILDVSKRHPVFFTERLKKAPMGVQTGGGSWCSPVAEGYVFNDGEGRRREGVGGVKL